MNIISEAAVYKLIMRSNKPIAQKFQEQVQMVYIIIVKNVVK